MSDVNATWKALLNAPDSQLKSGNYEYTYPDNTKVTVKELFAADNCLVVHPMTRKFLNQSLAHSVATLGKIAKPLAHMEIVCCIQWNEKIGKMAGLRHDMTNGIVPAEWEEVRVCRTAHVL